jgi:type II secretory ATPase GspE/PulE/Tfp pilus assembly ATPase PilB-like protein
LPVAEDIKRAVIKQKASSVISDLAVKRGMKTIEHMALQKAEQGVTSIDDIIPLTSELSSEE